MPVGYVKLKDFKGVNLTDPPSEIADDEFAQARNCVGDKRGLVGPRAVQTAISGGLLTGGLTVLTDAAAEMGVYNFIDKDQKHRLVFWVPGNVASDFYLGNASGFDFGAGGPFISWPFPVAIGRPLGFPSRPGSLVHNNELFLFPGHTVPGLIFGADDVTKGGGNTALFRELGAQGTGWVTGAGTSGDRFKFSFGDVYRGVFVMGGLPPPYESLIAFTQPGNTPDILLSTAKWAGIGQGDGDKLLRVIATPITGGGIAVEPYVLALKQRSVWLVQGQTPSSTDNGTIIVTPVMKREGLVAPSAVCHTPYGIAWCSGQNVWLMPPGTEPKAIGYNIKGFLSKLPQMPSAAWCMEFHDDTLVLNFPSPMGVVAGKGYGALGATRTYLATQQLWCDLRKPDEPRWWGPQDVRACHMRSLNLPDGSRQLSGLTVWDEGGGNVRVQPFTMNGGLNYDHATTTGQTVRGDIDLGDPGGTSGYGLGNTIPVSTFQILQTRDMDFGDDSLEKIIEALEVNATWDLTIGSQALPPADTDAALGVAFVSNGGRKVTLGQGPLGTATPGFGPSSKQDVGFVLDKSKLNAAVLLSETFIPLAFFPVAGTRLLARTVQMLLSGTQAYTANPPTTADQYITRKFTIKSLTVRMRPIGRRPGGSYGG